ncbi:MAG: (Fe-S)-binding protein [Actinomycetota bacterium]
MQGGSSRAFDERRPPELALLKECVHCGFCLPTCPTYQLWGEEMDSPRGRIVLMLEGLEPGSELSNEMVTHFDRCLGCMACVTACPSGVRYDRLIEATRPQVERNHPRPLPERLLRQALLALFTHPGRLRALLPLVAGYRRSGLASVLERSRLLERLPKLRATMAIIPEVGLRAGMARLSLLTPARGARRTRVGFLQGCVQRVFFPHVNEATVSVLAAEGCEVAAPAHPRCCGALMLHTGDEPKALALARQTIAGFEGCDWVAVNAAGCGSAMKSYADLLADDPEWGPRAAAFCAKVRDVSELLVGLGPVAERHPVALRVAYHDACHLAHAQGVRAQPRALLAAIPGLALAEPREWEICCGSAGIYNLLQPDAAGELGRRKAENLIATGADAIVAGNPGCALQIAAHLRALGRPLPLYHPTEILAASIEGRRL